MERNKTQRKRNLREKIKVFEFRPEVYCYPLPRMYEKLHNFKPKPEYFTEDINVYLHTPFCKQTCSYCGYLRTESNDSKFQERYVDSLVLEIKKYKCILEGKKIRTVNFGGGTPSLLTPAQFERIMSALLDANENVLKTSEEVSIESTPETVDVEKFSQFLKQGLNRVSLGVETFQENEAKLCSRANTRESTLAALQTLKELKVPNIVADLMIGIPAQTVKSFEDSAARLVELKPDTVELFVLGIVPGTKIASEKPKRMSNTDIYKCLSIGRKLFLKNSYKQEFYNRYSLPGKQGYLQQDFLFQGMSLLGFGVGARTHAKDISYRNVYSCTNHYEVIKNYMQKINSCNFATESGIVLDNDEKLRQYVIYNIESLNSGEFERNFGIPLNEKFGKEFKELLQLKLAKKEGDLVKLTVKGLYFRDLIVTHFFSKASKNAEIKYRPEGI